MSRFKAWGLSLTALTGVVAAALGLPHLLALAAGPAAEIVTLLKATEQQGLRLPIAGSAIPLVAQRHLFDRISVQVNFEQGTAQASSTLELRGTLGTIEVSSLGVER